LLIGINLSAIIPYLALQAAASLSKKGLSSPKKKGPALA